MPKKTISQHNAMPEDIPEDIPENMPDNDRQAFVCARCGHCCEGTGGIILTPRDIQRLAQSLTLSPAAFCKKFTEKNTTKRQLVTQENGYCVFFSHTAGCRVHLHRPDICRAWPFFRGNIIDHASWEMIQTDCKGVRKEAGHACFQQQGLACLRLLNLDSADPDKLPEALKIAPEDIKNIKGTSKTPCKAL